MINTPAWHNQPTDGHLWNFNQFLSAAHISDYILVRLKAEVWYGRGVTL